MKQSFLGITKNIGVLLVLILLVVNSGKTIAISDEQKRLFDGGIRYFDIESCTNNSSSFAGGTGDGYTAAAPNLKDPNVLIKAIDDYVQSRFPSSPFVGMGNLFVSGSMRAGINPIAVLAHAELESGMGTSTGDPQVATAFNAFGRTATSSQPHIPGPINAGWYRYDSWEKSLDDGGVNDEPTYIRQLHEQLNYDINTLDYVNSFLGEGSAANEAYRQKTRAIMQSFVTELAPGAYATPGSPTTQFNTGSSCTNSAGSNQIVGGLSLPVDRIWYDQNQAWFTKGHHDYPAADIPVPEGTPVYTMSNGTVVSAPTGGACGIGLVIDAGNGIQFVYCHGIDGGSIDGARLGDTVTSGQLIMHSGNTGRSTGAHLHVGINVNGEKRCPQSLFVGITQGSPPDISSLPSSGCISGSL